MKKCFAVTNEADTAAAELLIYDRIGKEIGGSGIDAKDVKAALDDIPKDREILVRINSPGGNLWDALGIYSMLSERRQRVTCQVDGVAASAASVVAIAGRETIMPENGLMMIHLPAIAAFGNAADLRREAKKLDSHTDTLTTCYGRKTGRPVSEILEAMTAETWFSGTEAKAFGLVDRITAPEAAITAMVGGFDFSKFSNAPAALNLQGVALLQGAGFVDGTAAQREANEASLLSCYKMLLSIENLKRMEVEWSRH